MKKSKSTYYYEFWEGYCAGATTKYFCEKLGKPTTGSIKGSGWGRTPKAARRAAQRSQVIQGNVAIECVPGHEKLFKNGKLIRESH